MRALTVAIVFLLAVPVADAAGPYDGSVPLKCRVSAVYACSDPSNCIRGTADTVLLPPVLLVDVGRRLVSGDAAGRTARITAVGHGGGRMLLHGAEVDMGGNAWNVVVTEASGAMTGAVLSQAGGFLMFGTCSAS